MNSIKNLIVFLSKNILIKNYNHSKSNKRALLVYITRPFITQRIHHTNAIEAKMIMECLDERDYRVDIIYYDTTKKIKYQNYDLIIGMGKGYINSLGKCKKDAIRLYLATGAFFLYANANEIERWIELGIRKHIPLEAINRLEKNDDPIKAVASIRESNAILVDSDGWSATTYDIFQKPIFKLGAIAFNYYKYSDFNRNIQKAKCNFLCITGQGFIHKGIDVLLEVFSEREDVSLYIIGPPDKAFIDMFSYELNKSNIYYGGFIDLKSLEYKNIAEKCAFSINASCSEGCCTSILSSMTTGLIPILSKYESVDDFGFGIRIDEINVEKIDLAIDYAIRLPDEEIIERMNSIAKQAENYTEKKYKERVNDALISILGQY